MSPVAPTEPHWSREPAGRWYRWRGYTVRWLLFGLVVSVFQPVADEAQYLWEEKLWQALTGLLFGAFCALVFTLAENRFNTPRVGWKSGLIVLATWLAVKVVFVSVLALIG
jgi:hypothetical protein